MSVPRRRFWIDLCALVYFVAVTVWLTWPLTPRVTTALSGSPDALLNYWALGWNYHVLPTALLSYFDANIFAPRPDTLAYSEHLFAVAPRIARDAARTHRPLARHLEPDLERVRAVASELSLGERVQFTGFLPPPDLEAERRKASVSSSLTSTQRRPASTRRPSNSSRRWARAGPSWPPTCRRYARC